MDNTMRYVLSRIELIERSSAAPTKLVDFDVTVEDGGGFVRRNNAYQRLSIWSVHIRFCMKAANHAKPQSKADNSSYGNIIMITLTTTPPPNFTHFVVNTIERSIASCQTGLLV